jgi:GNAT superfamily N-acetyltransferase
MRLSTQAGWNQTRDDWLRLLRLPGASVKVFVDGGEVRASYSLVGYGSDLAWVGMILVDEAFRGRGLGKMVFENALRETSRFQTVGLDATDFGKPIYLKNGFVEVHSIERWFGPLRGRSQPNCRTGLHDGILSLDKEATQIDRTELLRNLESSGATIFSLLDSGTTLAYGVIRPGRTAFHLGPVVARSSEDFFHLLDSFPGQHEAVVCDLLNAEAVDFLSARGWSKRRVLTRMTRPDRAGCLCREKIWCAAGFELG